MRANLERRAFVRRLLLWGRANRRPFPWRSEDDPFRVLVGEVLLQRSRAATVAKVYEELFLRWPTADALADANADELENVIRPLGLTSRAKSICALAARVKELGSVPRTYEALIGLPGVGRYAANATLVVAFDRAVPVVDGVTARVYRRYFGLPDEIAPVSDETLWELVAEVSPKSAAREWNWAVLDLAAAICKPKRPRCGDCPLADGCRFAKKLDLVGTSC